MADIASQASSVASNAASGAEAASQAIQSSMEQIKKLNDAIEQIKSLKGSLPKNPFIGIKSSAKPMLLRLVKQLKQIALEMLKNLPICDLIGILPLEEIKPVIELLIKLRNIIISVLTKVMGIVSSILSITSIISTFVSIFQVLVELLPRIADAIPGQFSTAGTGPALYKASDVISEIIGFIGDAIALVNDALNFVAGELGKILELIIYYTEDIFRCLQRCVKEELSQENPQFTTYPNIRTGDAALNAQLKQQFQDRFNETIGNISPIPEINLGIQPESYKGFTFDIKVKKTVEGTPQNYAIALDVRGIQVLESLPSFASDTNVLIQELKLIIDRNNLSGF
jgi:methyl-accepting chemotaxis protein